METSTQQDPKASKIVDPVIQEGKFFAAIGYLSVLCFVPILLKKNNQFAQFHGRQALVLFIFEIAAGILKVVPAF